MNAPDLRVSLERPLMGRDVQGCDHAQGRRSAGPRAAAETFDRSAIGGPRHARGSSRGRAVAGNRGSAARAVRLVMPGYLLDTNILSDLVHHPGNGSAARQLALVRAHGGEDISTSIIAAAGLRYGVAKRGSTRLVRQVETVHGVLDVLPF